MKFYLSREQMFELRKLTNTSNAENILVFHKGETIELNKKYFKKTCNPDKYKIICKDIYSLAELIELIPKKIKYNNNLYKFVHEYIKPDLYLAYYQNIYDYKDEIFEFSGNEFIDNLYNLYKEILINYGNKSINYI